MRWLSICLPQPDCSTTGSDQGPDNWLIVTGRPGLPLANTAADIVGRLAGHDKVVAVNGGFVFARNLGLEPDVVVGDLDSLSEAGRRDVLDSGCKVITHPSRKDMTDTHLALDLAAASGCSRLTVVMPIDGRFDHTLANVMLVVTRAGQGCVVSIVDEQLEAVVLSGPGKLVVDGPDILTVSLIPFTAVTGVTLDGLDYPLVDGVLEPGQTLGISNRTIGVPATVQFTSGILMMTVTDRE